MQVMDITMFYENIQLKLRPLIASKLQIIYLD